MPPRRLAPLVLVAACSRAAGSPAPPAASSEAAAAAAPPASPEGEAAADGGEDELGAVAPRGASGAERLHALPAPDPARLRRALLADPGRPDAPRLRAEHDRALLPCPGETAGASCTPTAKLVARGVVERAARYLAECLACEHRAAVEGCGRRARAALREAAQREARGRLSRALLAGDVAGAEQVLADVEPAVGAGWLARARRKVARARRGAGGSTPGEPGAACAVPEGSALLVSPRAPRPGDAVRVLAVSESRVPGGALELVDEAGAAVPTIAGRSRGEGRAPFWYTARAAPAAGRYHVRLLSGGAVVACARLAVGASAPSPPAEPAEVTGAFWPTERGWDRAAENLYSAWVEHLFQAPEGHTWRGLHAVTRDATRNLIHGHLGLGEDDERPRGGLELEPDCADQPYFLRAYFAWKAGLPFGRHRCVRDAEPGEPRCGWWATNEDPDARAPRARARAARADAGALTAAAGALTADAGAASPGPPPAISAGAPPPDAGPRDEPPLRRMNRFFEALKDGVHARTLRSALDEEASDLYPVELSRAGLRPGVVFSDPYGHTLTLVRWVAQGERPGQLLAVDAQPDGTLAIKRFWRGNFLFPREGVVGGHGFKAFRPVVLGEDGPYPLTNAEIAVASGYGDFSLAQRGMKAVEFHGILDRLVNPRPLPPEEAYRELLAALHRQLESRVREVTLGEEWHVDHPDQVIEMPEGRKVFNTTGPWEAFSTPCRDMRLLVGMDVVQDYPAQASLRADGSRDAAVVQRLEALLSEVGGSLSITYRRSDGSPQTLPLVELMRRQASFEWGYNPNDCPEHRWGAAEGSAERATCQRRAPDEQRARMRELHHWFARRYSCG
ncbi:MAG: hypothetical protein IT376_13750 [Polyangiaceae bacterium]|nr:hypothetical protein [Polyangiaceae bacterium]